MQNIKLKTPKEAKALGLRRISREERPLVPKGMTLKNCFVTIELSLDAEVLQFFDSNSEKINAVLRKEIEKKKLSEELLEDTQFVSKLREKLTA